MAWVMKLEELRVLACPGRAAKAPQVQVLLQALLSLGLVPAGSVGLPGPAAGDWAGEPVLAQAHCCPVPGSGCCCCGCLGAGPAGNCSVQALTPGSAPGPAVAGPDLCDLCCCCCSLPAEAVALSAEAVSVLVLG